MAKGMGIKMIEMYVDLLDGEFKEALDEAKAAEATIRAELEIQVKKDLGIFKLLEKKAKLKIQIEEIDNHVKQFTKGSHYNDTNSPLKLEVKRRLKERGSPAMRLKEMKAEMIKQVKLAALPEEVQKVFASLPSELRKMRKALPPIDPKMLEEGDDE